MKASYLSKGWILTGVLGLAFIVSCNRPISVSPTIPGIMNTRTSTSTPTLAVPPTSTATPSTVAISTGPSNPGASTRLPGSTDVPVLQVVLSNIPSGSATLTSLTLTTTGTGNDGTGIIDVDLYWDVNGNGVVDGGDTAITTTPASPVYSGDNGTVVLNFGLVYSGSPVTLLVSYDFAGGATPLGNYQPSLSPSGITGTDAGGQALNFSGPTVNASTLTIANATPTPTATSTPTRTNTGMPTATSTNTPTRTNTLVPTATNTIAVNTPTSTSTPTSTATRTQTSTNTTGATTPTFTETSTPCYPASAQALYSFDSSVDCWMPSTGSGAYIPYYGIDNAEVNQGTNSLHISVNNTSGSPQPIQLNLGFAGPIDLSGMMLVAQVFVDPSLAPSDYSGGVQPFYQSGPNWGSAVWDDEWFTVNNTPPANVGAWFPVTIIFTPGPGDPTQVLQVGIQLTGVPAGAVGNFYIDNLQIIPVPAGDTPTSTSTESPTATNTAGVPVCTVTPVAPNNLVESEAPSTGGATGSNETCGTAEDIGTANSTNSIQLAGSLNSAGNDGSNYLSTVDWDYYLVTIGENGTYEFTLDCYKPTGGSQDFDLLIFDSTCTYLGGSFTGDVSGSAELLNSPPLTAGQQYYVAVVGWDGPAQSPYRLVVTGQAAPTATPTDTDTPSVPTDTPTPTPTETPTDTPAGCVPAVQASYDFEASDECFKAWNGPVDTAFSVDTNPANTHNGSAGSFRVTGTFSAGEVLLGLDFPTPANIPMGSIVTFWYKASQTAGNAQPFHQSPGWQSGTWIPTLATTWTQVTFAMTGGTTGSTNQLGMQFLNMTGAVTIWIDDVTISAPPTPTPTLSSDCNPLLNAAESLTDNGTWAGNNTTRTLSGSNVTQGASSLQVTINNATGWNDEFLRLSGFAPSNWSNVTQLVADVYLAGPAPGYNEIQLYADSQAASKYYQRISTSTGALVAGANTVTWNIDWAPGNILSTDALSQLRFIYNSGASAGTGPIHIDNIRLVHSPCPPAPVFSWPFTAGLESWSDHTGDGTIDTGVVTSWSPLGYAGGAGAVNVSVPYTGTDQFEWVKLDTGGIDLTGTTTIEMYVWIDASIAGTGYPGAQLIVQSGPAWAGWEQGPWTNLVIGGWTKLTFSPTHTGAGRDITTVQRIAVQVHTGGSGTGQSTGNIKVDNVKVY